MKCFSILLTLASFGQIISAQREADVVFVLDESGSIWEPDFIKQLDFVQSLIGSFDVGFNRTHIGVLTFGTDNRVIFQLGQYTEEEDLKKAVKAIKQQRGYTYTNLALKRLREEMFSKKYSRSWVRQVAIVITDGESDYPKETEKEAHLCHEAGFHVIAIGVGRSVDQTELEAIASDPVLVFKVDDYRALETLRLIVAWKAYEYKPRFLTVKDRPHNVTVTEGDSVTFNCSPVVQSDDRVSWIRYRPSIDISWFQNGQPIDTDYPPERFIFSNNSKSLTIRDVCGDCTDGERKTDQVEIQCNASDVYGSVLVAGYLKVINKTKVMIRGPEKVSVDFREQKHFVFQCIVISDLSTPATVKWYKTEPYGDLVRDEPPYVCMSKEFLIIMVYPNCSSECAKYLGEYRCVGDNGYSRDNQTITLDYQFMPLAEPVVQKEEPWKLIVITGTVGLVLFLIGMFLGFRWKQIIASFNGQAKDFKLPNIYERVDYESVGVPLEEIAKNARSMPRARSIYEHTGYDTIDQVLEEMGKREEEMSHPPIVSRSNSYESMDTPMIEAINRGRAMMGESIKYDDMGYAIPLEEVTNRGEIDQHQVHGHDSIRSELILFPSEQEQSEAMNTYLDLSRKDVNPYLDQLQAEVNHNLNYFQEVSHRDRGIDEGQVNGYESVRSESKKFPNSNEQSEEMNAYSALNGDEVNSYLDLVKVPVPTEVDPYLDLYSKDVDPYSDMGQKEVNLYLDLVKVPVQTEVNPNLDLCSKEADPYLDMGQKEVDPYLDLCSKEADPYLDMGQKEVDPYLDLCSKEADPYLDMGQKRVDPYLVMGTEEVDHYLDMDKKEVDPSVYRGSHPILAPTSTTILEADYLVVKN